MGGMLDWLVTRFVPRYAHDWLGFSIYPWFKSSAVTGKGSQSEDAEGPSG